MEFEGERLSMGRLELAKGVCKVAATWISAEGGGGEGSLRVLSEQDDCSVTGVVCGVELCCCSGPDSVEF